MKSSGNRLTEIGRIGKSHGLDGTVRLIPSDHSDLVIEAGTLLYIRSRNGEHVPARVLEFRPEEKRNRVSFFVKLDRITSREEADSFRDSPVLLEYSSEPRIVQDTRQHDLTGYEARDENEVIGTIVEVIDRPMQKLISIRMEKEIDYLMVPYAEEYVKSVDHEAGIVFCKNLELLKFV
jgi:16S rRNA processing protein RimM